MDGRGRPLVVMTGAIVSVAGSRCCRSAGASALSDHAEVRMLR
jgi:hypothetical protein